MDGERAKGKGWRLLDEREEMVTVAIYAVRISVWVTDEIAVRREDSE